MSNLATGNGKLAPLIEDELDAANAQKGGDAPKSRPADDLAGLPPEIVRLLDPGRGFVPPPEPVAPTPTPGAMRKHLEWLVAPAREQYGDVLAEIAWDDGAAGEKNPISNAQLFPIDAAGVAAAAAHAAQINARGRNVYCGVTLKKPDTPKGKRTKATNFAVGTAVPIEFDKDGGRVVNKLDKLGVTAGLVVTTGRTPELREHHWNRLPQPCADASAFKQAFKNLAKAAARTSARRGSIA